MKKIGSLIALAALLVAEYFVTRWAMYKYDIAHGLDYFFSVAFIVLLLAFLDAIIVYFSFFPRDKSGKRRKPGLWIPLIGLILTVACMYLILALNPIQAEKLKVKAFGEKLQYAYDEDARMLTISGAGAIKDTGNPSARPWDTEAVETVVIEDGVTGIGYGAFQNCGALTSVRIPDSVRYIGMYAFADCPSLTELDLPEGLLGIEGGAFARNDHLASLTLPRSVRSVEGSAFGQCYLLEIRVADGQPYYETVDGVLVDRRTKTLVCYPTSKRESAYTIPGEVKAIGYFAFDGCDSLSSVVIPDGVSIDGDAFADDSLQIVCCNPGTEAEAWAERQGYLVLHTQKQLTTSAYAYLRGDGREMRYDDWEKLYVSAQNGANGIAENLALANDFAEILDEFASDAVFADGSEQSGVPPLQRCLDKISTISGTVIAEIVTVGDVEAYAGLLGAKPNGKVLPVYISESKRLVYLDPIAGLPEAFRPTTPEEVAYLLSFEFSVNYYGQYTSGAKAYTTDLELSLIELSTNTVVARRVVSGSLPAQTIHSSGTGSLYQSPPSGEKQAEAITSLLEENLS